MSNFDQMMTYPRSAAGWLALARQLADGEWHAKTDLAATMAATTDLQPQSASNLIRQALDEGYIRRRQRRGRAFYRVTEEGRGQRPELRVP